MSVTFPLMNPDTRIVKEEAIPHMAAMHKAIPLTMDKL